MPTHVSEPRRGDTSSDSKPRCLTLSRSCGSVASFHTFAASITHHHGKHDTCRDDICGPFYQGLRPCLYSFWPYGPHHALSMCADRELMLLPLPDPILTCGVIEISYLRYFFALLKKYIKHINNSTIQQKTVSLHF